MSNADDRCARRLGDRGICGAIRSEHYPDGIGVLHPFVEPAPQPATSGDEAKVRRIASEDDVLFKIAKEWTSGDYGRMVSAVRKAYAAGKADGAREERGYWLRLARSRNAQYVTVEELEDDQRPGARRGSEGK